MAARAAKVVWQVFLFLAVKAVLVFMRIVAVVLYTEMGLLSLLTSQPFQSQATVTSSCSFNVK
jgi:hypothetical protein